MDNVLCDHIGRSRLCAENGRYRSRRDLSGLDLQIFVDNVQRIELLAFVLVETFYLDVEDRIRADLQPLCLAQVSTEIFFVLVLDLKQSVQDLIILFISKKLLKLCCILFVAFANGLVKQRGQTRIAVEQPATEGNAVCLVVKFLRIDPVEIVQLRVLKDLCVQRGNAVYAESVVDVNVGHVHRFIAVNDGHALILIFSSHFIIQHLDDRHELRNDFLQIIYRPFFQRLGEDCMVRIRTCPGDNVDGVVHFHAALHQQTDHFRDHHGRMGVIDLDHRIVRQIVEIASLRHALVKDELCAAADHEILLIDTQQPSLLVAVVRIEEQRQVFLNVFFIKINSVLDDGFINRINIKEMEFICQVIVSCHLDVIHSCIDIQTSELNRINRVRFLQPGFLFDPRVRGLFLKMILKLLFEESQMVVQADTVSGKPQGCDRIKETCSQTSESAVSEGRLRLDLFDPADVFAVLLEHLLHFLIDAEVDHVVGEQFSDQELCRNVIKFFPAVLVFFACCHFLYKGKQAVIDLSVGCLCNRFAEICLYFFLNVHGSRSPFKKEFIL